MIKMKKLTKKQELKLWLKVMELEIWLKATRGQTIPEGAYDPRAIETEEI